MCACREGKKTSSPGKMHVIRFVMTYVIDCENISLVLPDQASQAQWHRSLHHNGNRSLNAPLPDRQIVLSTWLSVSADAHKCFKFQRSCTRRTQTGILLI